MTKRTKKVGVTGKYGTRYVSSPPNANSRRGRAADGLEVEVLHQHLDILKFQDAEAPMSPLSPVLHLVANLIICTDTVPPSESR